MAYNDYGGRSYVEGVSRDDKVDVAPGRETRGFSGQFHALLGEGNVLVGLYNQSHVTVLHDGVEVPLTKCLLDPDDAPNGFDAPDGFDPEDWYFNPDPWIEAGRVASFLVAGHRLDVFWTGAGDYFVHARLTEPDGTTWTGWSGYGIGAGHTEEGCREEEERIKAMDEAFHAVEPVIPTGSP